MDQSVDSTRLVPALSKAIAILDIVARSKKPLGLSEIARRSNLARSSVHSICHTLTELELLIRRSDQTFFMGPHVMRWANAFAQQADVTSEFISMWDHETELPGATITLSVLEGDEVVYIAARNSEACNPWIQFRAGMRLPAVFTATGKAFLSYMSDLEIRSLLGAEMPPPRTALGVRDLEDLLMEMQVIRSDGYSVDNQQIAEGIVCFGAAVLDAHNRPIAGIAVSLLADGLPEEKRQQAISNVKRIASRLSHRMGADLTKLSGAYQAGKDTLDRPGFSGGCQV